MSDIFSALDVSERQAFQQIYLHYLDSRNGTPLLATRTFSGRETRFRQLEMALPLQPMLGLDAEQFQRNLVRKKPEPGLDPRMLWALAMAKISRSERYGVDYKLQTCGFADAEKDDPCLFIEIEELYHSRIISLALRNLGLDAEMLPPSQLTQLSLRAMMRLPHVISDIVVLGAEVAGVTVFRMLAEKAVELFSDTPAALTNILELLSQLLVDEVGHVYFVRSRLDQARLDLAKLLLPMVARALLDGTPEVWPLFGRERLMKEILAADIPAAVAAFPDRTATARSPSVPSRKIPHFPFTAWAQH